MAGTANTDTEPTSHLRPGSSNFFPASRFPASRPSSSYLRAASPKSTSFTPITGAAFTTSPTLLSPKALPKPQPMTAASAYADQRRLEQDRARQSSKETSPNPARQALGALMGANDDGISPARENPVAAATTISGPLSTVAKSIQIPINRNGSEAQQTSPVSVSSVGTAGSIPISSAMTTTVASPAAMDEDPASADTPKPPVNENGPSNSLAPPTSDDGNKALSYPPPALSFPTSDPRRGMSLPHSSMRHGSPRSPSSNKKHKCPYCATEFTRHHNLKSHLLTHSQEKPYLCSTCQSRFRRLHDLKRHAKLHTGERPHICEKCGRRFARGDALARHNKGSGGCAGRRASIESYGGDDDYGDGTHHSQDDGMDGLVYTEPDRMDEDDERRLSMPSIRKHNATPDPLAHQSSSSHSSYQARQPSTYPPIQGRPSEGLFPPAAHLPGRLTPPIGSHHGGPSSSSTSPVSPTNPHGSFPPAATPHSPAANNQQAPPVLGPSTMTESPKPLSPSSFTSRPVAQTQEPPIHRNRSPSLTQQFQVHHYGRGRATPPTMLPQPHSNAPQLPLPHGLNPPDSRFTLQSQGPSQPGSLPHLSGATTSQSNSLSSHTHSNPGSGDHSNAFGPPTDRLWAYVRALEEKINSLHEEVVSLRAQVNAAPAPQALPSHSLVSR